MRDEKLQEERTSDDFIHKLIVEDTTDAGKRKTEDQKKEESLMVKMTQERVSNCGLCYAALSPHHQKKPVYLPAIARVAWRHQRLNLLWAKHVQCPPPKYYDLFTVGLPDVPSSQG